MKSSLRIIILLLTVMNAVSLFAESYGAAEYLPVGGKLYDIPAAQIVIFRRGEKDVVLNFGFQDKNKNVPVKTENIFHGGALVQPMTALAALRIFRKHGLKTDVSLKDVSKTYFPMNSYKNSPVTLRSILSMTSGLEVSREGANLKPEKMPSFKDFMQDHLDMVYEPGKGVALSVVGYGIVQEILETREKKQFREILKEEVLSPLNLEARATREELSKKNQKLLVPGVVQMGKFTFPQAKVNLRIEAGGGLYTSARDYAAFLKYLSQSRDQDVEALLQKQFSYHENLGGRALGFQINRLEKEGKASRMYLLENAGASYSGSAFFVPGQGGAVILINTDKIYFVRDMRSVIYKQYFKDVIPEHFTHTVKQPIKFPVNFDATPRHDLAKLKQYAELMGHYRPTSILPQGQSTFNFLNDTRIAITRKNGIEFAGIFQKGIGVELVPVGKDLFHARGRAAMDGWRVQVMRDKDGDVSGLMSDQVLYKRVPNVLSAWAIIIGLGLIFVVPTVFALLYFVLRKKGV